MIEMILSILGATFFGFLSYKPLKESAEYRFTKLGKLLKGLFYLTTGLIGLLFWGWALILGIPIAYFLEKKAGSNNKKMLN